MEKVHLRKLLQLFYMPPKVRTSALRQDIRQEVKKGSSPKSEGGDFHTPFWTDAKNHVAGTLSLDAQAKIRIESNKGRARLYPELTKGFLTWWNEKRRWQNEPFQLMPYSVKAQLPFPELGGNVKVENLLAVTIGSQSTGQQLPRIIYPYFSETPALSDSAARLGLWALTQALPQYTPDAFRVLDVLRSSSFAMTDVPPQGDEQSLFTSYYGAVLQEWRTLWEDYR